MSYSPKNVSEGKQKLILKGSKAIQDTIIKLVAVLVWAEFADLQKNGRSFKFDTTVVKGIMEYYIKYRHFTIKQANAVWKIHCDFKLDEWFPQHKYAYDKRRWDELMNMCNHH